MKSRLTPFAVLAVGAPLAFGAGLAAAQEDAQAVMKAFMDAHQKMMGAVDAKPTGDADKDFVMMMIPHHQGAIDMAEIQLKFGKDPALRELAEEIIESQKEEIEQMRTWQQEHGS